MESPLNATLIERIDLNPELAVFRIRPDSGQIQPFEPGQYAMLALINDDPLPANLPPAAAARTKVRLIKRAYSIASAPKTRDHMEFLIVLVKEGRLTPRLWKLGIGDRILLEDQAKGEFTLQHVPPGKDLVMVSTGTGLAPFMSMLRQYHGTSRWRRIVMINGCRYVADFGYREELEAYAKADSNVIYVPMATREPADSGWNGIRGRVNALLEAEAFEKHVGFPLDPAHCVVMLCGNPDMIDGVQKSLESRGFTTHTKETPGNIHFERYW